MLVEFWARFDGGWAQSALSGFTREELAEETKHRLTIYRVRETENDEWEFFPNPEHPHRYTNKYHGGAAFFPTLPSEPNFYPITDLLTRLVYEAPPIERNPDMSNVPAPPTTPDSLVDMQIKRHEGKLVLSINAKPLHDMLDAIGCRVGNDGGYMDAPATSFSAIRDNKLSTALFLRREYPVHVNLAQHYSRPASMQDLRNLCESGHSAVAAILQHYQPIDISYSIQKLVK